jgi:hypothetical protein
MAKNGKSVGWIPISLGLRGATTLALIGVVIIAGAAWAILRWHRTRELFVVSAERLTQSHQTGTPAKNDNGRRARQVNMSGKRQDNDPTLQTPFYTALEKRLASHNKTLKDLCSIDNPVAKRVLEDYGAMFLAKDVLPPPACVFTDETKVIKFQTEAKFLSANIGRATIELQPAAMKALLEARADAREQHLDITPRGGAEAARRSYADTLRLWNTRFLPGLTHWTQQGRLSETQAARLRQLPVPDQVREVLELEKRGMFFSADLSKSILYSIAAPGTSQHTAMLALDVAQFTDPRVRRILAAHGWFQTVKSDMPHFTYLGVDEKDLPLLGLRSVKVNSQVFWIPNVTYSADSLPMIR